MALAGVVSPTQVAKKWDNLIGKCSLMCDVFPWIHVCLWNPFLCLLSVLLDNIHLACVPVGVEMPCNWDGDWQGRGHSSHLAVLFSNAPGHRWEAICWPSYCDGLFGKRGCCASGGGSASTEAAHGQETVEEFGELVKKKKWCVFGCLLFFRAWLLILLYVNLLLMIKSKHVTSKSSM